MARSTDKKTTGLSRSAAKGAATGVAKKAAPAAAKKASKKATKKPIKKATGTATKKAAKKSPAGIRKEIQSKSVTRAPGKIGAAPIEATPALASPSREKTADGYRLPSADPVIRQLLQDLVNFLDEKKLADLRVINLEEVNPYFCFFVIVTANSQPQLQSVARDVAKQFGQHLTNKKVRPLDFESGWVIQDFVDIVLHLFLKEQREYYNLEKLWGDAPTIYSSAEPRFRWPQPDTKKAE